MLLQRHILLLIWRVSNFKWSKLSSEMVQITHWSGPTYPSMRSLLEDNLDHSHFKKNDYKIVYIDWVSVILWLFEVVVGYIVTVLSGCHYHCFKEIYQSFIKKFIRYRHLSLGGPIYPPFPYWRKENLSETYPTRSALPAAPTSLLLHPGLLHAMAVRWRALRAPFCLLAVD